MSEKLWAGRFVERTAPIVEAFTASINIDRRLYAYDIQGSIAHCKTLAKASILSKGEAKQLIQGLEQIKDALSHHSQQRSSRNSYWHRINLKI